MSLKAELETWAAALKAYDEEDFEKSLDLFSRIADSSKILTNMGLIHATVGEHDAAVERFIEATSLDQYLAVAYFQCGVSNFLLQRYEMALKDFEEAFLYLRGNQDINYEQLGLKFRLYSAEVLFNKGLAHVYLGRVQEGLADMEDARRDKATEEHNVIDDAIKDRGEGYTVFSIPVGVLYRPSEKKLKNAVTKDYMGKAKLVAASDPNDAFTEFTGVTRLKHGISPTGIYVNRPNIDTDAISPISSLSRSTSAPRSAAPRLESGPRPERSRTMLNVPASARESPSGQKISPFSAGAIQESTGSLAKSSNGPVRGSSHRRPGSNAPTGSKDPRVTEFYDDYLDSYPDQLPLPPIRSAGGSPAPPDRVAAWARSTVDANYNLSRSASRSGFVNRRSPSSGTIRRKPTRRGTTRSGNRSTYEEEEGYVSGDYEDAVFDIIRVKIHYQDDVRGMTFNADTPFEDFISKLTAKFDKDTNSLGMKFADEDGVKITLRDESDFELAIATARTTAKGKPEGKLEIWCSDR